jgi:enoyl-CoA hydratase/carnithine racemase
VSTVTELIRELDDGIALLQLNRPQKMNAVNAAMRSAIQSAMHEIAGDPQVRVVIITGAGKAFCAGMDLSEAADNRTGVQPTDYLAEFGPDDWFPKPVITAVNGAAYGGGFRLAQFGDLCIASDNATFAIPEAKWGRGMPWAAPLTRMLPRRILSELLLTGEPMSAARAFAVGLVNEVVSPEALLPRAWKVARTIADNAPLTITAAKWLIRVGSEAGVGATHAVAGEIFRHVYASEDAIEGPRAFREGRKPAWQGR